MRSQFFWNSFSKHVNFKCKFLNANLCILAEKGQLQSANRSNTDNCQAFRCHLTNRHMIGDMSTIGVPYYIVSNLDPHLKPVKMRACYLRWTPGPFGLENGLPLRVLWLPPGKRQTCTCMIPATPTRGKE